jgi:hypothetical protein
VKAGRSNRPTRKSAGIILKSASIRVRSARFSRPSNRISCRSNRITCMADVLDLPSSVHSRTFDGVIIPFDEIELR